MNPEAIRPPELVRIHPQEVGFREGLTIPDPQPENIFTSSLLRLWSNSMENAPLERSGKIYRNPLQCNNLINFCFCGGGESLADFLQVHRLGFLRVCSRRKLASASCIHRVGRPFPPFRIFARFLPHILRGDGRGDRSPCLVGLQARLFKNFVKTS